MEQLAKIRRVIQKRVPAGPHETLLVLDGTIGQNGLSQARKFNEATPLTGVVITKLDGTAKGGMVLTVAAEMGLPVKLVGIGEQIDDLRDFDPEAFVDALA
jgi:fused signal recognition particle receptor